MKQLLTLLIPILFIPFLVSSQITQEHLDVSGAITINQSVLMTPVAGTIEWDGNRFMGYNGSNWVPLDDQSLWIVIPGPFSLDLFPGPAPAAVVLPDPAAPNAGGWLYIHNAPGPVVPHHMILQDLIGLDASMSFSRLGAIQYSLGLDQRGYYQVAEAPLLPPPPPLPLTSYGNQQTALEIQPGTGIVNMPRQSKAKAWLSYPQFIPPMQWTPIGFDRKTFDEHNEFVITPTPPGPPPGPPETSFFTATEEGWYHVEARCEFNTELFSDDWIPDPTMPPLYFFLDTFFVNDLNDTTYIVDTICYMEPQYFPGAPVPITAGPDAWVSIGIFSGGIPGFTNIHSQGNNLQLSSTILLPSGDEAEFLLRRNNAPNVSGLVHLKPGHIISVWVWHTAISPLNLLTWYNPTEELPGPPYLPPPQIPHESKVYVSITKVN